MKLARISLPCLMVVLFVSLFPACSPQKASSGGPPTPPPAPVKIAEVKEQAMPVELMNIGSVEAYSTIMVKAQISEPVNFSVSCVETFIK